VNDVFFTIVNPAAGHGRCGREAGPALDKLRNAGLQLEVVETKHAGHGIDLTREAFLKGYRRFLGVGGDGIIYEIVNGLFPGSESVDRPTVAVLPLGTGNSFLRDFTTERQTEFATRAILEGRSRPCDVMRMKHRDGVIHYINLLSVGFTADAAAVTNREYKRWGHVGYLLGVFTCLIKLDRRPFPCRMDGEGDFDRRPCLFLTFNNSKFTGRTMMIAPNADSADGLIEYVRWGPIGRLGLIANLGALYDGSHVNHPLALRRAARRVEFALHGPVDVMVDGEVLTIHCETLDVLPSAINFMV
jgi:YegS/Rv2252/BmrU family lipid kinase